MTTRWADGFEDTDNTAATLSSDYSVTGTWSTFTGRRTSTSAVAHGNAAATLTKSIGGTQSTMFASMALNAAMDNANLRTMLRFNEGATTHVSIAVDGAGQLLVYRGDRTTLLGTSSAFISANVWTWFQVKVLISDTVGTVEIRDSSGGVLLNLSGLDTRNGGTGFCDAISIGASFGASHSAMRFDDLHVWDSTGSICNTWTNDTRIDHRVASGAGNSAQFTASAGANFSCTDEQPYNTTDYVESATAGHKDTYAFGDISHSPPNIFSVLITAVAQKDDAGARSLKTVARSGGTDYADATGTTLGQAVYSRVASVRETDPATSAAWTQSGVNSAEFGFENV